MQGLFWSDRPVLIEGFFWGIDDFTLLERVGRLRGRPGPKLGFGLYELGTRAVGPVLDRQVPIKPGEYHTAQNRGV